MSVLTRNILVDAGAPALEVSDARSSRRWALRAALLAAALCVPFAVKGFVVFQLTMALVYAIAILGLTLLTGVSGQISLGHSAFFAVGAYTAAGLVQHHGVPYLLALPAAAAVSFAFGVLFRLPVLRLDGIYLALATFALAVATPQILKAAPLARWTGGSEGIVLDRPAPPLGVPLDADHWLYALTLAVAVALAACAASLVRSRTGRALLALRDNPIAAAAMGIDTARYKTLAFGVSALYAGVAGALSALVVQIVAPDGFTFMLAIALFVGMVVGGAGSVPGALAGGLFVLFMPNVAERLSKGAAGAVYGGVLLVALYVMPSGAAGMARAAVAWWRRPGRRGAPEPGGNP
jgi:branched-chain amino acid transport system permease protein